MGKKIKSYIKTTKNSELLNSTIDIKTTKCKEIPEGYYIKELYQNNIEQHDHYITIKAYVEKTIDLNTTQGKAFYEKYLQSQKSPIPSVIRSFEKENKIN